MLKLSYRFRAIGPTSQILETRRGKKNNSGNHLTSLFEPVPVKPNPDDINVGAELTGALKKGDLLKILNQFAQKGEVAVLSAEHGLDRK